MAPNGLGVIGPPSSLTAMVPVIIISLTVDYAIQAVSHYREQRLEGEPVVRGRADRTAKRHGTADVLAAVTTMVSLLATLFSPIGVIGDFGVVAAYGRGVEPHRDADAGPGGADDHRPKRREARGKLRPPRPLSNALPGIPRVAEVLGRKVDASARAVHHRRALQ